MEADTSDPDTVALQLPPLPPPRPALGVRTAGIALLAAIVGAGLGAAAQVLLDDPLQLTVADPVLDVRAPEGARVTIDGTPYTGPAAVPPGVHAVEVTPPGGTPWRVDLQLVAGELRVLVVDLP